MKVFISWSGDVSKYVALALRDWLPSVLQNVEPFVSSEDIQAGGRWFEEIGQQLEQTDFGILCLTPDNRWAPWLLFEAGALSKQVTRSNVVPLLIGLQPADVTPPLSSFQGVLPQEEDVWKMMKAMNSKLGDAALAEERLKKSFDKWWPDLEEQFRKAEADLGKAQEKSPKRSKDDMLAEVLELTRGISRQLTGLTVSEMQWREMGFAQEPALRRERGAASSAVTIPTFVGSSSGASAPGFEGAGRTQSEARPVEADDKLNAQGKLE